MYVYVSMQVEMKEVVKQSCYMLNKIGQKLLKRNY